MFLAFINSRDGLRALLGPMNWEQCCEHAKRIIRKLAEEHKIDVVDLLNNLDDGIVKYDWSFPPKGNISTIFHEVINNIKYTIEIVNTVSTNPET